MAQVPTTPSILDSDLTPEWTSGSDRTDLSVYFSAIKDNAFDGERIDGMYRGGESGVQVLAITSRRLMMVVESALWKERLALISVPYGRVTAVGILANAKGNIASSTTIGIQVSTSYYEMVCESAGIAREAHDLITWTLVN